MTWAKRGRSKYGAIRTEVDGIWFDSKREAQYYSSLKAMQAAGRISKLETHPRYPIIINGQNICSVELDFAYIENEEEQIVDVKGKDLPMSRLKRKLVEAQYGIKVQVVK